jgi:nucleotide-binding universal stress UspA family protein
LSVLIGYDETPYGHDALALGVQLAGETDQPLTVTTVFPDDESGLVMAMQDHEWLERVRQRAERKLDTARALVGDRTGIAFEAIGPTSAARGLHEYAEQIQAGLLVVGSSAAAAMGRIAPGSTVSRLLHGAPCPVAVAPRGYRRRPTLLTRIAVAYDGSTEAQHALDVAVPLAQRLAASLRLVAVTPRRNDALRAQLDAVVGGLPAEIKAVAEVLVDDDLVDALADLPGQGTDLLVCGSRGYGPVRQVLLGGVSSRVVRAAAYPVMIVPRRASADLA